MVKNHCEKALGNATAKPKQITMAKLTRLCRRYAKHNQKWRALTSICKFLPLYISQYMKQQKQIMVKSLELSEVYTFCMLMNILKYSWIV